MLRPMVNFRKSKKIGGVRFTVSKSGISASTGVRGARASVNSKGKVRRTVGIPGTGIYDTKVVGTVGSSRRSTKDAGAASGEQRAPAGWYPVEGGQLRYWDGSAWTEHFHTP